MRKKIQRTAKRILCMILVLSMGSVSYTHLDVYKRQGGDLSFFKVTADFLLVGKRYLRIGNHRRQKKRMGRSAFRAFDPADPEPDSPGRQLYGPPVVTMDRQTGRMRTGTGQLVKLDFINNRIIKGLRNLIAIWDQNGYHSIVNRHRAVSYTHLDVYKRQGYEDEKRDAVKYIGMDSPGICREDTGVL